MSNKAATSRELSESPKKTIGETRSDNIINFPKTQEVQNNNFDSPFSINEEFLVDFKSPSKVDFNIDNFVTPKKNHYETEMNNSPISQFSSICLIKSPISCDESVGDVREIQSFLAMELDQ